MTTVDFTKADPTFVKHAHALLDDIVDGRNRVILDDLVSRETEFSNDPAVAANVIRRNDLRTLAGACLHEYAMTIPSYIDSIDQALNDAVDSLIYLHITKNSDYSSYSNDRWANIRTCEYIGIPATTGILVRVLDKINRYISLTRLPQLPRVKESLEDTLLDIVGYLLIHECLQVEAVSVTSSMASSATISSVRKY